MIVIDGVAQANAQANAAAAANAAVTSDIRRSIHGLVIASLHVNDMLALVRLCRRVHMWPVELACVGLNVMFSSVFTSLRQYLAATRLLLRTAMQ